MIVLNMEHKLTVIWNLSYEKNIEITWESIRKNWKWSNISQTLQNYVLQKLCYTTIVGTQQNLLGHILVLSRRALKFINQ